MIVKAVLVCLLPLAAMGGQEDPRHFCSLHGNPECICGPHTSGPNCGIVKDACNMPMRFQMGHPGGPVEETMNDACLSGGHSYGCIYVMRPASSSDPSENVPYTQCRCHTGWTGTFCRQASSSASPSAESWWPSVEELLLAKGERKRRRKARKNSQTLASLTGAVSEDQVCSGHAKSAPKCDCGEFFEGDQCEDERDLCYEDRYIMVTSPGDKMINVDSLEQLCDTKYSRARCEIAYERVNGTERPYAYCACRPGFSGPLCTQRS